MCRVDSPYVVNSGFSLIRDAALTSFSIAFSRTKTSISSAFIPLLAGLSSISIRSDILQAASSLDSLCSSIFNICSYNIYESNLPNSLFSIIETAQSVAVVDGVSRFFFCSSHMSYCAWVIACSMMFIISLAFIPLLVDLSNTSTICCFSEVILVVLEC